MKHYFLILFAFFCLASCGTRADSDNFPTQTATEAPPAMKFYENDRFRQVRVLISKGESYKVSGQARVFEGTLNYAVVRQNREVLDGFATASMGAPEWGDFSFSFTLETPSEEKSLLRLFEVSAKDGSRSHILEIPLP